MSDVVAGNGLLSRRLLLRAGAAGVAGGLLQPVLAAEGAPWTRVPGAAQGPRGQPSPFARLEREQAGGHPFGAEAGSSSTPLQGLNGTLTPNALHFERHHSGIPAIDPARHRLVVNGAVRRPLQFSCEDLAAYPLRTQLWFLECSGNSWRNTLPTALDLTAGELNGLVSGAEWTGIPVGVLLDEAGVEPGARWVVARGADAAGMARSVPLDLCRDEAIVALYQNGEPLRPAQGYPLRLFVPGCEGNLSVKWLSSLQVQATPAYTRDETSKYTDLRADGRADMFSLRMEVKSVITAPSGRMSLPRPGVYEISGLAWSGHGAVRAVEVSADGGRTWASAALQSEARPRALARFRIPWRWDGGPAVLQSRAVDDRGHVQPSREQALAGWSPAVIYHYNGIQSWAVDPDGRIRNAHA
jgi:sulfane dehydrogenase subunit SoxC